MAKRTKLLLSRAAEATPLAAITLLGCLAGDGNAAWLQQLELSIAMFLLALFAFRFNDMQDIPNDRLVPERAEAAETMAAQHAAGNGAELVAIVVASLVASWLGGGPVSAGLLLAGAACAVAYSWKKKPLKQVPVAAGMLHLAGADCAFCLGWWAVDPGNWRAPVAGLTFGLVFAAGHLHHEAIHMEQDERAGVRTQAVRFGRRNCLIAAVACWLASVAPLSACSWFCAEIPDEIGWINLTLVTGYIIGARHYGILSAGPAELKHLRRYYRALYAAGGVAMAAVLLTL